MCDKGQLSVGSIHQIYKKIAELNALDAICDDILDLEGLLKQSKHSEQYNPLGIKLAALPRPWGVSSHWERCQLGEFWEELRGNTTRLPWVATREAGRNDPGG